MRTDKRTNSVGNIDAECKSDRDGGAEHIKRAKEITENGNKNYWFTFRRGGNTSERGHWRSDINPP